MNKLDRLKWGPFVSERSWGTIREDMDFPGDVWNNFSFEQSHYRVYRFGEDAIAGFCDRYQLLVISPVFYNFKDPLLKEKLFGLSSHEGNHGEDVKEIYFHKKALPDHRYMQYIYRYPQEAFPYEKLKQENGLKKTKDAEYELVDTHIFDDHRFFDIKIEYVRLNEEDLGLKITAENCSNQSAPLEVLAQLVLRMRNPEGDDQDPFIVYEEDFFKISDEHVELLKGILIPYRLGTYYFYSYQNATALFCENKTRPDENASGYKDSFHRFYIQNDPDAMHKKRGTKAALAVHLDEIKPKEKKELYFTLTRQKTVLDIGQLKKAFEEGLLEFDRFYDNIVCKSAKDWEQQVQKEALSSLLWTQSIYLFDVDYWLKKRSTIPFKPQKNLHWQHLNSKRIMIMPDKWEYPWFASWDMAFHALAAAFMDPEIGQEQLGLLLYDQFQHPNGQIPAYEWEYSDINPPVQAFALLEIYKKGKDLVFLEKAFHKLLINFAWWVNRVDPEGKNIFEGGFLGLDNIALWDRSESIIHESVLKQPDSTGWMALFCLNMMKIALELAENNNVYSGLAIKFFEHFVYIAQALSVAKSPLWDKQDGFFYDHLDQKDLPSIHLKIRSIVGIIPLFAVEFLTHEEIEKLDDFKKDFYWFLENRKEITEKIIRKNEKGFLLTALCDEQINSIFSYVANPDEFLAPFGMRSLSLYHKDHPYSYLDRSIQYEPRESLEKIKGGNSNWRGPIWMPMNYLIVKALEKFEQEDAVRHFEVHNQAISPLLLKQDIVKRIVRLFEPINGTPVYLGEDFPYRKDPLWTNSHFFYEYFDPDTGKGLGACHQTGWTALIAELIQIKNQK